MKGKCILAGEHSASYLSRLRKKAYEGEFRKKPHGAKLVPACGNSRCIAVAHIRLQPWAMFGKREKK